MEKLIELGARPITFSDSSGYIYDEKGVDKNKLDYIMQLKNVRRGRVKEYATKFPSAVYTPVDPDQGKNPLWEHHGKCAFPSATQNEINDLNAYSLVNGGVYLVSEGANMPCTPEAVDLFLDEGFLYGPGKAANAGGVAVSGLEMTQNSQRLNWTREENVVHHPSDRLDRRRIEALPVETDTKYILHFAARQPLILKVDGCRSQGVILF